MNKHIGSCLDDFLEEDGTLEEVEAEGLKRVIVWQVEQAMKREGVNKSDLAKKMHTSRTAVNKLLDKTDAGMTINTLTKVGRALGMSWKLETVKQVTPSQAA